MKNAPDGRGIFFVAVAYDNQAATSLISTACAPLR